MTNIYISLGNYSFHCFYGFNCSGDIANMIGDYLYRSAIIFADECVWELYGEEFHHALLMHIPVYLIKIRTTDVKKTITCLAEYVEKAIQMDIKHNTCIITFGGGIVGNLGGMVAALLFRGLPLIHIPTTTVAMFDSAISIRQSVSTSRFQNNVGIFYAPVAIFLDLAYLETLTRKQFNEGMVELLKSLLVSEVSGLIEFDQIISNPYCHKNCYKKLLNLAIDTKIKLIKNDPLERKEGLKLHYGHTFARALETVSGGKLTHGEAVAIGMSYAAQIAYKMGLFSKKEMIIQNKLLTRLGLSLTIPADLDIQAIIDKMRYDEKQRYLNTKSNNLLLVLLKSLGQLTYTGDYPLTYVPIKLIEAVLNNN